MHLYYYCTYYKKNYTPIALQVSSPTLFQLSAAAQAYFSMGISAATKKAYRSGLQKYVALCSQTNQPPIPVSEDTLLLFVTHLAQQNLSYATIQVYLSAVQYSHITTTESETSDTLITPWPMYVLKDIRKTCALTCQPRERLPITFSIMKGLHTVFSTQWNDYRNVMIWAACCLAYFGLLRVSEFTTASPDSFSQSTNLLSSDVALDSRASPTLVQVTLRMTNSGQATKYSWANFPSSLLSGDASEVPEHAGWYSRATISSTQQTSTHKSSLQQSPRQSFQRARHGSTPV